MNLNRKLLQIGTDTYEIGTDQELINTIKSVVIHHQGELSTIKLIDASLTDKEQQAYVAYRMMEGMQTTSEDDVAAIAAMERSFTKHAIYMGSKGCRDWMEDEFDLN